MFENVLCQLSDIHNICLHGKTIDIERMSDMRYIICVKNQQTSNVERIVESTKTKDKVEDDECDDTGDGDGGKNRFYKKKKFILYVRR